MSRTTSPIMSRRACIPGLLARRSPTVASRRGAVLNESDRRRAGAPPDRRYFDAMPLDPPPRFRPAVRALEALAERRRYRAAFVFGSLARGEAGDASDVDANVLTAAPVECQR